MFKYKSQISKFHTGKITPVFASELDKKKVKELTGLNSQKMLDWKDSQTEIGKRIGTTWSDERNYSFIKNETILTTKKRQLIKTSMFVIFEIRLGPYVNNNRKDWERKNTMIDNDQK